MISGSIVDAATKLPVEFATVALQDKTGKTLDGATCDAQGRFTIPKVAPGSYNLLISFIGYQPTLHPVTVTSEGGAISLGKLELPADSKSLKEVQITAQKPMVEDTDDGFVYNAAKDINATGATAADLLKNVPGLSVDMDGNLEMQGSPKIQVLIDGKPSSLVAGDLAEALRQIPSDIIEKVEVVTSPSAKYDGEGIGGVVNIITKKDRVLQGYNGSVNATTGNRINSLNTHLNARKGKLGLRTSLGGNVNRRFGNGENEQVFYQGKLVSQNNEYTDEGQGFNGSLGGDLDLNKKNSLRATLSTGRYQSVNDRINNTLATSTEEATFGQVLESNRRIVDSKGESNSLDANLAYTGKFNKKNQELNILMRYGSNQRENNSFTTREEAESIVSLIQQNNNRGFNGEFSFQADYVHPLGKWGRLETGAKAVLRQTTSNYLFASAEPRKDPQLVVDPRRTNIFSYDQNVYASYLSYNLPIKKKHNLRLGGRYENTTILADFASNATSLNRAYHYFMPNVAFNFRINNTQRLGISYMNRIQGPQVDFLNPYLDDTNERSIRVGNPNLSPEISHSSNLHYSNYIKTTTITTSVFWRQTANDIGAYRTYDRRPSRVAPYDSIDVITTTFLNIGKNTTYGANFAVSSRIKQIANAGMNLGLYYNEIHGVTYNSALKQNQETFRSSLMYNLNFNASCRLPKDIGGVLRDVSAQFSTSLNSPRIHAQGKTSSFQRYNMGLQKELWNKTATVSLSIENFLNSGNQIRTTTYAEKFTTTSIQNYYNRVYRLSLHYRIKKMEYKKKV